MLDIKGKKFGKLTVLGFSHYKHYRNRKRPVWKCVCECGQETFGQTRFLLNGSKTSCGCQRKQKGKQHQTWKGCGELSLTKFNRIKEGAKARNIKFDLTIEFLWELFKKQNGRCALSGEELNFTKIKRNLGTASLDRIDSLKPYVETNVQWVHKDVNFMKSNLTELGFKELINKIYKNAFIPV